jgi:protein involved in polysaccharide export with SLBB domain
MPELKVKLREGVDPQKFVEHVGARSYEIEKDGSITLPLVYLHNVIGALLETGQSTGQLSYC